MTLETRPAPGYGRNQPSLPRPATAYIGEVTRPERAIDTIEALAASPTDLASFWRECMGVIKGVVPYFWAPCFFTLDPASLLITSHFHEGMDEFPRDALAMEYYGADDPHRLIDVVRSRAGISTLHEVTGGDPRGTTRWQANMAMGGDQELTARLRTKQGETWGALSLTGNPAPRCSATMTSGSSRRSARGWQLGRSGR